MTDETKRPNIVPYALAALLGAGLFSIGAIAAVTATGGGMMESHDGSMMGGMMGSHDGSMMGGMMGDEMMDKMDAMHEDCLTMMSDHHDSGDGNETASG